MVTGDISVLALKRLLKIASPGTRLLTSGNLTKHDRGGGSDCGVRIVNVKT